jgi:hypothetical protein
VKAYFILFVFLGLFAHAHMRRTSKKNIWVFFDLGNTIIDTKTHNYNPMFYMQELQAKDMYGNFKWKDGKEYQSAREYIQALQKKSFQLGLLTDVPEEWGLNYPPENPIKDLPSAKILRLIDFLGGKVLADKTSWKKGEAAWDFSPFGKFIGKDENRVFKGALFLPQKNIERKNKASKVLFERGLAWAAQSSQKDKIIALYIGEDLEEMQLAEEAGMIPFQVGVSSTKYFYPPPEKIAWYAENYEKGRWRGLGENDFR